jgi:ADP-ribose pyrophosphatase
MSKQVKREVLRSGAAVAVLLYDAQADSVILIEQFRVGAYLNGLPERWILECVAGMVDEGETPEAAARREAEEETGCKITSVERIGQYLTSPGITDEIVTIFVARADAAHAGGVHGLASEAEDIQTRILKREEALAKADRGEVVNIVTQVALLWFARHGEALRQRWIGATVPASNGHAG